MKARELIKQLRTLPPATEIYIQDGNGNRAWPGLLIGDISQNGASIGRIIGVNPAHPDSIRDLEKPEPISITLTMTQLLDLVEAAGFDSGPLIRQASPNDDPDEEIAIEFHADGVEVKCDDEQLEEPGEKYHFIAFHPDYREEGVYPIGTPCKSNAEAERL